MSSPRVNKYIILRAAANDAAGRFLNRLELITHDPRLSGEDKEWLEDWITDLKDFILDFRELRRELAKVNA